MWPSKARGQNHTTQPEAGARYYIVCAPFTTASEGGTVIMPLGEMIEPAQAC